MPERVLAGCTQSGNCPGVTDLGDGRVLVTGAWHCADGAETTVLLPVDVFDRAARKWLRERRTSWLRMVPMFLGCAAVGTAVTYAAMGLGASSLAGHLVGMAVTVAGSVAVGWREGGRDA